MHKSSSNFFELLRVDFLLNDNLEPRIIGAKAFPEAPLGKTASEEKTLLYDQIVYNALNLVGAASRLDLMAE